MQQPDLHLITAPGKVALSLNLSDGSNLLCNEVVRVIRNKRLVCKGVRHQKPVYAKIFIGDKNLAYAKRDEAGVKFLQLANIETPSLLCSAGIVGYKGHALILSKLLRHFVPFLLLQKLKHGLCTPQFQQSRASWAFRY